MNELLNFLKSELNVRFALGADMPILSSGLIDSLRFASMLAKLEARYGVRIDPSDVGADNFDTPSQMHDFLSRPR